MMMIGASSLVRASEAARSSSSPFQLAVQRSIMPFAKPVAAGAAAFRVGRTEAFRKAMLSTARSARMPRSVP